MTKPAWIHLHQQAMGMSADFMANPLRSTDLSKAQLLMRESIQNCLDERLDGADEPVRVIVRRREFKGEAKRTLVTALRLNDIKERAGVFPTKHGWLSEFKETLERLDDPEHPFCILSIEDHNTNGLGGQWNHGDDLGNRFHNLVLSVGDSSKFEQGANLIGSYGIGKMVFALASNLRTIAYYSTFPPSKDTGGAHARFMATGFFTRHTTDDGKTWTGHAFLGQPSGLDDYPAAPLVDGDAHRFMERIGFERRLSDDPGLTVLLLDCPISIEECIEACERFWWPRIIETDGSSLKLAFFDNDRRVPSPQPTHNPALQPFIECYRSAVDLHPVPDGELFKRLPKQGLLGGTLALKAANASTQRAELDNSVALVRRGLVVRYETTYAREGSPEAVGVFNAHQENGRAFTLSEPEAHDHWNANNDRLRLSLGAEYQRLISQTHSSIKNAFRDFQIRLEGRPKRTLTDDIEFLDGLLGPIFEKRKSKRPKPPAARRAVSIQKRASRREAGASTVETLEVWVTLTDVAPIGAALCTVNITLKPLTNADGVAKGEVPRIIYSNNGDVLADASAKDVHFQIEKSSRVRVFAEAKMHSSWKARWVVTAHAHQPS
jgi:hypothetical protein